MPKHHLSSDQIEHFLQHGYVVLEQCFSSDDAHQWIDEAWHRLGYDRDDPATWDEKRVHLSSTQHVEAQAFAPAAWNAATDLLGGEDRVQVPWRWSNGFIANLGVGDDRPWEPPSAAVGGWHKDGDFFRHFLDSPEQGLLTIVLWTDMLPQGGGTFVAADSLPVVARFLADHPEGLLPTEFDFADLISHCHEFVELTGKAGDVVLIHPYVLHATSQNVLQHGRLITNPPIALREPMDFSRANPDDFSLVERGVLRALGVERLDFQPKADREAVVPQRVIAQQARDRAATGR